MPLTKAGPADGPAAGFTKSPQSCPIVRTPLPRQVRYPTSSDLPPQDTEAGTGHVVFEIDFLGRADAARPTAEGYVGAHLTRHDLTGAWTGAAAGIRIPVQ